MKKWLASVLHNSVAHPLMPFIPAFVGNAFHNWTATVLDESTGPPVVPTLALPVLKPGWRYEMAPTGVTFTLYGWDNNVYGEVTYLKDTWVYHDSLFGQDVRAPSLYEAALRLAAFTGAVDAEHPDFARLTRI